MPAFAGLSAPYWKPDARAAIVGLSAHSNRQHVARAAEEFGADCVVAEKNFGGDMVRFVIKTAEPKLLVRMVAASRGKVVRAEPVSALYGDDKGSWVPVPGVVDSIHWKDTLSSPDEATRAAAYAAVQEKTATEGLGRVGQALKEKA